MASFRFAAAAVRQFSTSAARNGEIVQAPIQVFGIEGRYAHALYSAAVKQKKLDAVDKDMQTVQKLIKSDTKFAEFLHSPLLKRSAKTESLSALLKKQGFTDISVNFFETLGENGRLAETTGIVEAFLKITSAEKGEVMCKVTTAQKLDDRQLKDVKAALQMFLTKNQVLNLELQVDPELIGGMTVSIGDKHVDMSMATKYKMYSDLVKETLA